jgi:N-acetylornithine carbamoyltransferase
MPRTLLRNRDWITTQEWSRAELEAVLGLAQDLKMRFSSGEPHELLRGKTNYLIFYNPSLRTRNSFETGMTQLGGHANFLSPSSMYSPGTSETAAPGDLVKESREAVSDTARVLSRYGHAISIRMFQDATGWVHGRGNAILREFAKWADIPIINMEDDVYHPCQAMADLLTLKEHLGNVEGKKIAITWAYSDKDRTIGVMHSAALLCTRFGMNVTVAHPKGYEFDDHVTAWCQENAAEFGGSYTYTDDIDEAFRDADAVMPKSWISNDYLPPKNPKIDLEGARELNRRYKHWKCTEEKLGLCKESVLYMHCAPVDRGNEVTDEIVDGPRSVVFDQAENRLHVQKAIMCLVMGGRP